MATQLGQAYVQIIPSSRGITGSIQKVLDPEATSAGKSAGTKLADSISSSLGSLGKTLTKSITLPAMGAAAAAGGVVAALGWGRLTGLDSARAQLEGLGYDLESVERISGLVSDTIQGTTTTMAEGVSTAAGALAAGVAEGAELERYIRLVGDAAVGAGRSTGDMAQIFNRVQGAGKLMTMELNMIEDGMPGFAMAMADSLGVPQDEFRKMVTEGKVSSEQFLDVMEGFAGNMSDAYAGSWKGIVSRTKSNIGILGEIMLGGVFEQSKESLAGFLEFIRTDDVRGWFSDAGAAIGQAFTNVIETVKSAIDWWINLDTSTQDLIKTIGLIAVTIGPILTIGSKLIAGVTMLHGWFGLLQGVATTLVGAIGAISAPVLIVVGAIAGFIAILVNLYRTNEEFRDKVNAVWETVKELMNTAIQTISNFVRDIFGSLVAWWKENQDMILEAATNVWNAVSTVINTVMDIILGIMQTLWPIIEGIVKFAWDGIKNIIEGAIAVITGIVEFFSALFTGNWSALWESVKNIVTGAVQAVWGFIQLWIVGKIVGAIKAFAGTIKTVINSAWTFIKNIFSSSLSFISGKVSSVLGTIKGVFTGIFNSLKGIVTGAFNSVKSAVTTGMNNAWTTVTGFFSKFKDAGRRIVTSIADGIKGAISTVTNAISSVTKKIREFLPFSPAKEGPLKDLHKLNFGGTISLSIKDGEDEVEKAMNELLNLTALDSKVRVSPGQGLNRGTEITQNITVNSPKELSPSETARQVKNASRNLAMEW